MKKQLLLACVLLGLAGVGLSAPAADATPQGRTVGSDELPLARPASPNAASATVIWGAGAPVGYDDGEFANAFVQSTSSVGADPNSWTAVTIDESGGAATPGNAYWTRTLTGRSVGAYSGVTIISSPSQVNGAALFDSDFLDNAGIAGNFGGGTSPSPHRGELISPRIDLTGYTDVPLAISFYSYYRDYDIFELSVSISTDDGVTWSTPVDYRPLIGSEVQGFTVANFATATAGVANLTQCRVKLTFDGDYYFAIVDDLSVQTAIANDLALGVGDSGSNVLVDQGDYVNITGNRYFPISQLVHDERHFALGGTIKNLGVVDVLPSTNPLLQLTIEKDDGGTWITVFTDAIAVTDTIPGNGFVTTGGLIADYSWVAVGDYRATYTASFDGVDEDLSNNSLTHFFSITPDDYVSKVDLDGNDDPLANGATFAGGGPFSSVEYGSVFYFDSAESSDLRVDTISYRYRVPASFSSGNVGENQTLLVVIYEVDASTGTLSERDLLTQIGVCQTNLTGLGTVILPGEYGTAECAPVDVGTGLPLDALASGHYFVSVAINPALFGGPATFSANDVPWFGTSDVKNYYYNISFTGPDRMINVSPVAVADSGGTESWYWSGFGADRVPSIGVNLIVAPLPDLVFDDGFESE